MFDAADNRDYIYTNSNKTLRENVDLRQWTSPVEEQLNLGSCTGQAIVGAYELLLNQKYPDLYTDLSRLFVYYNARQIEGYIDEDVGAYVRNGVKAVALYGVCAEVFWPYDIEKFNRTPNKISYIDANTRRLNGYYRITSIDGILDAINNDKPVVAGIHIYNGFYNLTKSNNILEMPGINEEPIGGHAMCIVGYDLPNRLFIVRNSFGIDWGDKGYCLVPFEYVINDFVDCWTFNITVNP